MDIFKLTIKTFGIGIVFLTVVTIFSPSYPILGKLFDSIPLAIVMVFYIVSEFSFKTNRIKFLTIAGIILTILNYIISIFILKYDNSYILMYMLPIIYTIVAIIFTRFSK